MDEESAGGSERARARGRATQVRSGAGSASRDDEFAFEIAPVAERWRGGEFLALVGRADRAEPAIALSADRADPFPTTPVTRGSSVYRGERTVASPVQMLDAFFSKKLCLCMVGLPIEMLDVFLATFLHEVIFFQSPLPLSVLIFIEHEPYCGLSGTPPAKDSRCENRLKAVFCHQAPVNSL